MGFITPEAARRQWRVRRTASRSSGALTLVGGNLACTGNVEGNVTHPARRGGERYRVRVGIRAATDWSSFGATAAQRFLALKPINSDLWYRLADNNYSSNTMKISLLKIMNLMSIEGHETHLEKMRTPSNPRPRQRQRRTWVACAPSIVFLRDTIT